MKFDKQTLKLNWFAPTTRPTNIWTGIKQPKKKKRKLACIKSQTNITFSKSLTKRPIQIQIQPVYSFTFLSQSYISC